MEKALAYIDLVGFGGMVSKNREKATSVLSDFYSICYSQLENCPEITGYLFSDSFICFSENKTALVNCVCSIMRKAFLKNQDYADKKYFLLPRGGISVGIVDMAHRAELPNLQKGFIISPALVHNAKIEKSIKGARLLVAIADEQREDRLACNSIQRCYAISHFGACAVSL